MRGSPQQLRHVLARSLSHLVTGSLVLTAAAVSVAAWAAFALAMAPTPAAAVTISAAAIGEQRLLFPSDIGPTVVSPISDGTIQQSPVAALAVATEPSAASEQQTGSSAISSARRDDFSLLDSTMATTLSVDQQRAALVASAATRGYEASTIEASYPIDASIFQTPALRAGDVVEATISFYYCVQGETSEIGDGGSFCDVMRDGTVVYDGAAACAWAYLGQRFVVVGDPLERIYTCADTGSAVHGLHRDIWFYTAEAGWAWQLNIGTKGLLVIVD